MRYNKSSKVLTVGEMSLNVTCPHSMEVGEYEIVDSVSLEFAQINGSPYGWSVGNFPILSKESDHGIFTEDYEALIQLLETSSLWQGTINEIT